MGWELLMGPTAKPEDGSRDQARPRRLPGNLLLAALAAPLMLLLWSGAGHAQNSAESALGDPTPPAVLDPSINNSPHFPASLGTSGIAATGPSRPAARAGHVLNCSARNPCALPTPARDRVTVAEGKS